MFQRIVLSSLLMLCGALAHAAQPLVLLTENFPPYNMAKNGKSFARDEGINGIATDIVREMFRRAEVPYSITLRFPWARSYQKALDTPDHGIFVLAREPEREALFKWVGPIGPDDWILLAPAGSTLRLEHLEQAKGLRIGAYKGDAIAAYLTSQGFAPELMLRDRDNARKLQRGEIDLWASGDPAGRYLARQDNIHGLMTVLRFHGSELYLALNRQVPDEVVARLQGALEQMRADGFVEAVFARYL
ncbi:ABC transporter substrate-binding protein [Pseudomonas tructae]|uniref:ABC transporter substrate-binding protein n=1 Tax=Pseudomonas tructae TaxID=2518644 RepID=A0A411MDA4_9PSED|nr:ABC transporter substrate-binding protein [Pseudomonas tructae]QBF24740.1 ABC transporter substrate-binding protein [Pseudomonas tructae]